MHSSNARVLLFFLIAGGLLLAGTAQAGSIVGTIKYEGAIPNLPTVKMGADPGCAKKHSTAVKSEALVLGEGNTMANIFVQVSSGLPDKKYPTPTEPKVLDQEGCRYVPHVMGIMVGQPLKILNSDGLLHNIHALPKINKSFNQAMPASVTETVKSFTAEEPMFKIKCDVHPWMGAYVTVLSHPFYDVTGTDGKFKIDNLPPGTYEVEAWHEKLGTRTSEKITIAGDETKTADFTISRQ